MGKGIAAIAGLFTVTIICWGVSPTTTNVPFAGRLFQLFGALALVGFAVVLLIATRLRLVNTLFGGLDKAYVVHKWLTFVAAALVVAHVVMVPLTQRSADTGRGSNHAPGHMGADMQAQPWGQIGQASVLLFLALIIAALFMRRINYQTWKTIHQFTAIPYIVGLVHYYGASRYTPFGTSPFSLWLDLVNIIGIAAAIYSVLLYERFGFPYRFTVIDAHAVAPQTIEITGQTAGVGITHRPGQFAFVKFLGARAIPSHPFTITGEPAPNQVQFTIKAAGDHTARLVSDVKVGDVFVVSRADGEFDYTKAGPNQLWIAGGAGIAPFRRFLQAGVAPTFSIDCFFAHQSGDAPYIDELSAMVPSNVRLHLIDAEVHGLLQAEAIKPYVTEPVDVFFCGPKPMWDALRQGFKRVSLPVKSLHRERYHLRGY